MALLSRNGLSRGAIIDLITGGDAEIEAYVQSLQPSQPAGVWAIDPRGAGSVYNTVTQNQAELARVSLTEPVTIDRIRIANGSTVNGNIDVGVYRFNGTNYDRIGSSGSTAQTGASATQEIPLTAPVEVRDGDYLAFVSDSATAMVRQLVHVSLFLVGAPMNISLSKASSFPLPATISSPSGTTRTILMVGYD